MYRQIQKYSSRHEIDKEREGGRTTVRQIDR